MEIPNTIRRHEVEVKTRVADSRPLHPPASRRPGRANKTDPISWRDRKKLAMENFKSEWNAHKKQVDGEDDHQEWNEQTPTNGSEDEWKAPKSHVDGERDAEPGRFDTNFPCMLMFCKPCSCLSKECFFHSDEGSILRPYFALFSGRDVASLTMNNAIPRS